MLALIAFADGVANPTWEPVPLEAEKALIRDLIRGFASYPRNPKPDIDYSADFDARALEAIGPAAEPQLVEALANSSPRTRGYSARCLEVFHDPKTAAALRHALDIEGEPDVKGQLASAYGACAGEAAVSDLMPLTDSSDDVIRRMAVDGLGNTRSAKAIPCILRHMVTHTFALPSAITVLAYDSGTALAKIGSASLPALEAAFEQSDPDVRKVAAYGLMQLNDPRATAFVDDKFASGEWPKDFSLYSLRPKAAKARQDLPKILESDSPDSVTQGLYLLTSKPSRELAPILISGLFRFSAAKGFDKRRFEAACSIATKLSQWQDRRAVDPLRQILDEIALRQEYWTHPDEYGVFTSWGSGVGEVVSALASFRDPNSLGTFLRYTEGRGGPTDVRGRGLPEALGLRTVATQAAIGCALLGKSGLTAIFDRYRQGFVLPEVFSEAVGVVDDRSCRAILVAISRDDEVKVRVAAVEALGNIAAGPDLLKLLHVDQLQEAASTQLLRLGNPQGLPYFKNHEYRGDLRASPLNSYEFKIRAGLPLPTPFAAFQNRDLLTALNYTGTELPLAAAVTLASRKVEGGWECLRRLANGTRMPYAPQAIGFLSRNPTGKNRAALLRALSAENVRIRFAAYEALKGKDASQAVTYWEAVP